MRSGFDSRLLRSSSAALLSACKRQPSASQAHCQAHCQDALPSTNRRAFCPCRRRPKRALESGSMASDYVRNMRGAPVAFPDVFAHFSSDDSSSESCMSEYESEPEPKSVVVLDPTGDAASYIAPFPQTCRAEPLASARNATYHRQLYKFYRWSPRGSVVQVRAPSGLRVRLLPPYNDLAMLTSP